ncbi:glutaredoxin 3 [Myxococcota bacterium]|nr:glutaredoxin 3 [Myxococcota bacterium]
MTRPIPAADRPVVLYKTERCPYCVAAGRFLREVKRVADADIAEVDLTGDDDARIELARVSGRRTVPQIWIGGQHVGGYDDLRALDARGALDPLLPRR